jgi:hypothetical protein
MKQVLIGSALLLCVAVMGGCEKGDGEKFGEKVDNAMEKAADRTEDAAEEVDNAIEDAAEEADNPK